MRPVLLMALLLGLAGCIHGSGSATPTEPASPPPPGAVPDAAVAVRLTEWAVQSVQPGVDAGLIVFEPRNTGDKPHDFVVLSHGEVVGEVADIAPGMKRRLRLDLDPGEYALLCDRPGHSENGMVSGFTVR